MKLAAKIWLVGLWVQTLILAGSTVGFFYHSIPAGGIGFAVLTLASGYLAGWYTKTMLKGGLLT